MSGKRILLLVILVALLVVGGWWYTSLSQRDDRRSESPPVSRSSPAPREAGNISPGTVAPLLFNWSRATPIPNGSLAILADSLRNQINDDEALKIIGHYFSDEENNTDYPDLGFARAYATRALLASELDTSHVVIASREVALRSGVQQKPFGSVAFSTVPMTLDAVAPLE